MSHHSTTSFIYSMFRKGSLFLGASLLFSNALALTPAEVENILSRPFSPDLIANNLRTQLGRENLTKSQAQAIVQAFQRGESWQPLVPAGLMETTPPTKQRPPLPPKPAVAPKPKLKPKADALNSLPTMDQALLQFKPPVPPKPKMWVKGKQREEISRRAAKKWLHQYKAGVEYKATQEHPNVAAGLPDTDMGDGLSNKNISNFLRKENLINKKLFETPGCLSVESAPIENRGNNTEELFFVKYNPSCPKPGPKKLLFIVKQIPEKEAPLEMKDLNELQKNPKIRQLGNLRDPSLPQITFVENFYPYTLPNGERKYLSLIHSARGRSLFDYMDKGMNSPKTYAAFKKLGEVLGNFYKRFMSGENCKLTGGNSLEACKVMVHGDLHPSNVFYDGKFIYFIDNANMGKSWASDLFHDPAFLFALPVFYWGFDFDEHSQLYKEFLNAYLQTLTPDRSLQLEIRDYIIGRIAYLKEQIDEVVAKGN